jgi:hypothetical protein
MRYSCLFPLLKANWRAEYGSGTPARASFLRVRMRVQRDEKAQFVLRFGLDETWYRIPDFQ